MSLTHGGGLVFIFDPEDAAARSDKSISFTLDGRESGLRLDLLLQPETQSPGQELGKQSIQLSGQSLDDDQAIVAIPHLDRVALSRMFPNQPTSTTPSATRPVRTGTAGSSPSSVNNLLSQVQFYSRIPVATPALATTLDDGTLDALGNALSEHVPGASVQASANSGIPAAYTYFGQFVAHDMSFLSWDPTLNGTGGWKNAHTLHALDFETLFGTRPETGPRTSTWEERADSALGLAASAPPGFQRAYDLPRAGAQGQHCSRDPRADTNLALAQMNVLLARFHQKASVILGTSTVAAREVTRKHLQAVVLTDYLKRIIPDTIYQDVMTTGRKLVHTGGGIFFIPIEFAVACFRFGHSMVDESYVHWTLNHPASANYVPRSADLSTLTYYTENGGGLVDGCQPIGWCQAWRHMVDNDNLDPTQILFARPIQASLAPMFRELDKTQFPDTSAPLATGTFNLAAKTLNRGKYFELPSGQRLAQAAGLAAFDIAAFMDSRRARFDALADDLTLTTNTPLWFYILAEAEGLGNSKLGPLGARIVMETFHAALTTAQNSILSVARSGATTITFNRQLRTGAGAADQFSLSDVVAVANGGVV